MSTNKPLTTTTKQLDELETTIDTLHSELRKTNLRKRKVITEFMNDLMNEKIIELMSTTQLASLMSRYIERHSKDI